MMRVQKILTDMDRAVEWMSRVKEHGGIEEAEAARAAAGEQSIEHAGSLSEARPIFNMRQT